MLVNRYESWYKMITVKELLKQNEFSMLNPLTSDSTLNKEIKTIDVVEVPDVAKYTSENGLILTTAMAFQDNQKELISFIDSLISIQTTALCIKTSRFLI